MRACPALAFLLVAALGSTLGVAQTVRVVRRVKLRPDPTTEYAPIRLLGPSEPLLELIDPVPDGGYYHVRTTAGEEGFVWGADVRVSTSPGVPVGALPPGPGIPGSASMTGCGDGLWRHVYHPSRLLVKQDCITVSGVLVDATANQPRRQPDGVRHEADGDTHGWLRVDRQFADLINGGNAADEDGNLVFELVCHFEVTQADAKPACAGFRDTTRIPPIGTRVAITGTLVQEKNHGKWDEIHPVSAIQAR